MVADLHNILLLLSLFSTGEKAYLDPPLWGIVGNVIHELLVLLPLLLPADVAVLRFAHVDAVQDCLVLLGDSKQLSLTLLTVQTECRKRFRIRESERERVDF